MGKVSNLGQGQASTCKLGQGQARSGKLALALARSDKLWQAWARLGMLAFAGASSDKPVQAMCITVHLHYSQKGLEMVLPGPLRRAARGEAELGQPGQ